MKMSLDLPSDVSASLNSFIVHDGYRDEVEVIRDALSALEYRRNVAAIQEGVDDMEAGRYRPFEEVDAEIRKKFGFKAAE
jgi:predicted transcriptional regulator